VSSPAMVGRRGFIKTSAAIGGGLLVSWYGPDFVAMGDTVSAEGKDFAINAFVRIGTDETVTVISAHSEMGQGVYTSLPMLLNEELQADWSKIRVEAAPVDKVYNHPVFGMQMTGGSTTSPAEWERYRKMGAVARVMLIQAAAKQWNVGPETCEAEKPEGFYPGRQGDAPAGYSVKNEWYRTVRIGCALSGYAHCRGHATAGVWRASGKDGPYRSLEDSGRQSR